jgi:multidrug resistance efflux pump
MICNTQPLQQLRDWLHRNAAALQLDRATVRSPQPGVVTARTTCGDLIRYEVTIYPRGVQ